MITEITKKKWYLHLRQTKVISVAGYPEFSNDIYISTFANFREPRFLTISGQLDKANPNLRDHLEYELAQYLVDMHNASLVKPKENVIEIVEAKEDSKVEVKPKKQLSEKQRARYEAMRGKPLMKGGVPIHLLRKQESENKVSQPNGPSAPPEQESLQVTGSEVQEALSPPPETSQSNHEGGLFKG